MFKVKIVEVEKVWLIIDDHDHIHLETHNVQYESSSVKLPFAEYKMTVSHMTMTWLSLFI